MSLNLWILARCAVELKATQSRFPFAPFAVSLVASPDTKAADCSASEVTRGQWRRNRDAWPPCASVCVSVWSGGAGEACH